MKTMNDFNSDDDDNDDFLVDCKIYLLGKKIYQSTLTKDRSIIYCIEC